MKFVRTLVALSIVIIFFRAAALGSAYDAQPKLVVIIIVDQFRAGYLERARDQLAPAGFRLLTEKGAYFDNCEYDYVNTETAPGHATLLTGAYTNGHGIGGNHWWDPRQNRMVSAAFDAETRLVGIEGPGASPRNLLSDTLGDELRLATDGQARVFTVSLKDRSAIFSGGFAANAAFWIDRSSGAWVSSTFYMQQLPSWVAQLNSSEAAAQYWNRDWKDEKGTVLRTTTRTSPPDFYEVVGSTPFGDQYTFEFARKIIGEEHLGEGPATDLLVIGLSATDLIGHKAGPNSPEVKDMVLALDRELADFFRFLGQRFGLANVWIAFSSDHGISPVPALAHKFRLPGETLSPKKVMADLNAAIAARVQHPGNYVMGRDANTVFLSEAAFSAAGVKSEADAERTTGDALLATGMRAYFTRVQLAAGNVPNDAAGRQLLHSYSAYGGWYVLGIPPPHTFPWNSAAGTMHGTWYTYDRSVPLAFFGAPFQPGLYREHCEPVDMAVTVASLLGINAPDRAVGRVLTEAIRKREVPR